MQKLNTNDLVVIKVYEAECSDCGLVSEHILFVDDESYEYDQCMNCSSYHVTGPKPQ